MFAAKRPKYIVLIPIALLIGFSFLFYYLTPESIIGFIGVENAYVLIFILAFIGGLTTFSGVPYHLVLIALAAGGLNPFLLGVSSGIGVILGDSTSYYIGHEGRALVTGRLLAVLNRLSRVQEKYPRTLPWIFFLFSAFLPISNDVIAIPAGLLGYSFWRVMIPLALGNIVFNTGVALLAVHGYGLVQGLL